MNTTPVKKIATVLGAGSLLLGAVVMAPSATAATPATTVAATPDASGPTAGLRTSVVAAWYENFLGRSSAGDAGAQYWVVRLRTEPYDVVLGDLLRTREAATKQVTDLYQAFLGRGLDPGASYWVDGIVSGAFPAEWAEQNILGSTEYVRRSAPGGGDAYRTVRSWYRAILGRDGNAGEIDYWAVQLEDQSPLDVVRDIWFSPEGVSLRVATHYGDYLGRPANSGEVAYWSPAEVKSDIGVVIAIASSAEYQENALTKGVAG